MRPVSLHLENFGPYKNEIVDFSRLKDAKLFLIAGKTGSGKTTLFDAMTFALYGDGSSDERDVNSMRSDFAQPDQPTKITFTFTHQGKTYEIMRRPKQTLARKNEVGTKVSPAKGRLKIYKNGKEINEITKIKDIGYKINDLLHLSRQQFIQIVLLPQGDFRRFLMGSSDDKESILRKIFKTQVYQKWGQAIHEKLKDQKNENHHHQDTINTNLEQFDWSEQPKNWQKLTFSEKLELLTNYQKNICQDQNEQKKQLKQLQSKYADQTHQLETAAKKNQQIIHLQSLKNQAQSLSEQAPIFDRKRQLIKDLIWAQKYEANYNQLNEKRKANQLILDKIGENKSKLQKQQEHQSKLSEIKTSLLDDKSSIKKDQQKSLELKQHRKKLLQREAIQKQLDSALMSKKAIVKQQNELKKELKQTQVDLTKAERSIDRQADVNEFFNQESKRHSKLLSIDGRYQELEQQNEDLINLSKQQQEISTKHDNLKAAYSKINDKFEEMNQVRIQNQIAELVSQLKPGHACPVCGSLNHPNVALINNKNHFNIDQFKEIDQQRQKLNKQLSKVESELVTNATYQKQQLSNFNTKLQEIAKNLKLESFSLPSIGKKIKEQMADNEIQLSAIKEQQSQIDKAYKLTKQLKRASNDYQQQIDVINQDYQLKLQVITTYQTQIDDTQDAISNQIKNINDLDQLQIKLTKNIQQYEQKVEQNQNELNDTQKTLASLKATILSNQEQSIDLKGQIELLQQKIREALKDHFNDEKIELLTNLLPKLKHLDNYQDDWQKYQDDVKLTNAQLHNYQELVGESKTINTEELVKEHDKLKQQYDREEQSYDQHQQTFAANENLLKQIQFHQSKIEQNQSLMNQRLLLDQTVNGSGDGKLSLERYVLRAQLVDILSVADLHFQTLSSGRYSFQLHENSGSYRKNTGLEIDVYDDHVGKTRSVHTLSGGESFIASLSLALALGEVIQQQAGGITIDTLFIDEGFGSLDRQSLEVAMQTFENIDSNGRIIGIISHVKLLEERIPYQIRVETNGQGQSHTKILTP